MARYKCGNASKDNFRLLYLLLSGIKLELISSFNCRVKNVHQHKRPVFSVVADCVDGTDLYRGRQAACPQREEGRSRWSCPQCCGRPRWSRRCWDSVRIRQRPRTECLEIIEWSKGSLNTTTVIEQNMRLQDNLIFLNELYCRTKSYTRRKSKRDSLTSIEY